VIPLPSAPLSETAAAFCTVFIALVPLAVAGMALLNTGLGRSRSAAHSMLSSLGVVAVAALVYFAVGFTVQGFAGRAAHVVWVGGKPWNWIASEPLFFRGLQFDGSPASLAAVLQLFSVGLAAAIPVGAGAERWRLGASCLSTAFLAGWTYPLFAHWVWGGGWLAQLGSNSGLGHGFLDAAGGSTVQVVGGLSALTIAWILGPRRGRYAGEHLPTAYPGHNMVFVLFACLLAFAGWAGLNAAGALLFAGTGPKRLVVVILNTMLSASASVLTAAGITRMRFGKLDPSLSANGWMGGLVASSAACAFVSPLQAMMTGVVAGAIVTFAILSLDRVLVDDPGGAVAVHSFAGMWGVLAVGIFQRGSGQWLAQLAGVATLVGFVLPLTYVINWLLDRLFPQRVDPRGERDGMDFCELGAGAYPEMTDFR
jgi:Amt family ammonium transporter